MSGVEKTIRQFYSNSNLVHHLPARYVGLSGIPLDYNTYFVRISTSRNDRGRRGCRKFVSVLGGDGTKIAPPGDIFDHPPGETS